MTKQEFKICESVALGLTHYYMGPKDKREVTEEDRSLAENRWVILFPKVSV